MLRDLKGHISANCSVAGQFAIGVNELKCARTLYIMVPIVKEWDVDMDYYVHGKEYKGI